MALQIDTPILILPSEDATTPPEGAIEHAGKRAEVPRPAATAPALRMNPLLESTCAIPPRGHASHAPPPTCPARRTPYQPCASPSPHALPAVRLMPLHASIISYLAAFVLTQLHAHLTSCSPNFVLT